MDSADLIRCSIKVRMVSTASTDVEVGSKPNVSELAVEWEDCAIRNFRSQVKASTVRSVLTRQVEGDVEGDGLLRDIMQAGVLRLVCWKLKR